jgi:Fe2+ or Zn2+ uptake regulation protein
MKAKRRNPNRCEASGYRIVGRDFYSVSEKDGHTICDQCGKVIKLRQFNGMEFIPAHNVPAAAD